MPGDPQEEFASFFEQNYRPLGRLALLLTSNPDSADDLVGDTMLAVWRQWDRRREVDDVLAYVRRIMVNLAASKVRRAVRERNRLTRLWSPEAGHGEQPDVESGQAADGDAGHRSCGCG